jgi:hypothetical protein
MGLKSGKWNIIAESVITRCPLIIYTAGRVKKIRALWIGRVK